MPEAITKNRQSEANIKSICEKAFQEQDIVASIKELTDGFCNTAYDIKLKGEKEVILKVAPLPMIRLMSCEVDMMKTEVAAMVYAHRMGVRGVPKIYFYDESQEICSSTCFLMEKLEGNAFCNERQNMEEEEIASLHMQTGEYLRELHRIKGERFGHFCREDLQRENWFEAFAMMIRRVIGDGIAAGFDIGVSYETILEQLQKPQRQSGFPEGILPSVSG